mgnify:CR=1 FL=1
MCIRDRHIDEQDIKSIKSTMPELPEEKRIRFMRDYSLSEYDASVLITDKNLSLYFESVVQSKKLEPKNVANWILTDLLGLANKNRTAINELPITPDRLEQLLIFVHDGIISNKESKRFLKIVQNLKNFEEKNSQEDFDKAAEDLRLATRHLGMIVGKVDVEEILGSIFSDFCIGK